MTDETAWVIERDIHSQLHYWAGRNPTDWRTDHMDALRFARQADAELMLTYHCDGIGRVVEHMWCALKQEGVDERAEQDKPSAVCTPPISQDTQKGDGESAGAFDGLTHIVEYARKDGGHGWLRMAAFDSEAVAERYAANQDQRVTWPWRYRVVAATPPVPTQEGEK